VPTQRRRQRPGDPVVVLDKQHPHGSSRLCRGAWPTLDLR